MNTTALPPFRNEPFTDFSAPDKHRAMLDALARVRSELGRTWDLVIGGHPTQTAADVHLHQSCASRPDRRHALRRGPCRGRARHRRRHRRLPHLVAPSCHRTRRHPPPHRAAHPRAPLRALRLAHLRGRQELGRGRRRRRRDHRLPRVLRPRSPAPRRRHHAHPVSRRTQRAPLHPARRRRGHSAVELPLRHHGRHDRRRHRHRQHRHPQALDRRTHHRRHASSRSSKKPASPTASSTSARLRRPFGNATRRTSHRPASSPSPAPRRSASRSTSAPPAPSPARSGSSAPSSRWAARTRSSSAPTPTSTRPSTVSSPQPSASAARSAPPAPAPSLKRPSTTSSSSASRARCTSSPSATQPTNAIHRPGHQQGRLDSLLSYIEIGKKEGKLIAGGSARDKPTATAITFSPPSSPTSRPTHVSRRRRSSARSWPSSRLKDFDEALAHRQQHRVRPHRRHLLQRSREKLDRAAATSTSAISTSTASAPARWSARTPSAAST